MPPCSATHLRRVSLFVPHSIQLRGHELTEAGVFALHLLQVVPMSKDYHNHRQGKLTSSRYVPVSVMYPPGQ
jgi:hypothetical protein